MRKNTLLIMPAHNEDMNIGKVIDALKDAGMFEQMDLLVINDGSTDSTAEVVRQYREARLINQIYNMGYGAALQTGYKYAVEHGYDYVLQMDSDGQHDVCNLEVLLKRLKGDIQAAGIPAEDAEPDRLPDMVVGSRFLQGSTSFTISSLKKFAIAIFRNAITRLTGYHLTDPTSGLQGLNRNAFSYFAGYTNFDIQYPDLNVLIQMLMLGYHIEEIPAVMHERTAGISMHSGLLKAGRYMIVMLISTVTIYNQYHRLLKERRKSRNL